MSDESTEETTTQPDDKLFDLKDSDATVNVSINATSLALLLLMMVPATAAIAGDFIEAVMSGHTMRRFMDARPELMLKFQEDIEKLATASCDANGHGDKYREAMNAQR